MKDHKVITMEDILTGKVNLVKEEGNRYCKVHAKLCEYYCETEKKVLCRDCVILNECPAQHTRVSLKKAAENHVDDLKKLKRKCGEMLLEVEDSLEETHQMRKQLQNQAQAAKESLATVEKECIDRLKKRVKLLQNKVDQVKEEKKKKLDQKEADLESITLDIETLAEDTSRVLESESEFEIMATHATLFAQHQYLPKFKPEALDSSLGQVKFEAVTPVISPLGRLLEYGEPGGKWKKIGHISTRDFTEIRALDVDQDGNIVVCVWAKGFRVFSRKGEVKSTHMFCSPHFGAVDFAVTPNQDWVTAHGKKIITYDSRTGSQINSTDTGVCYTQLSVHSVAVDSTGRIIVGLGTKTISVHNADGSLISKFTTQGRPNRLAVTSSNQILCSFCDSVTVYVQLMDYNGGNIRTIQPPAEVTTWRPGYVCCKNEELFICNHSAGNPPGVYRFTSEGDYLGCVTTDILHPRGLALSKDGMELFVADCNSFKVFQRP